MKPWQCQLALAVTQTAFCVGSVYLKSSLRQVDSSDGHVFHPIIYAFLREATAGPIMCAMAWFSSGAACVPGCRCPQSHVTCSTESVWSSPDPCLPQENNIWPSLRARA